VGLMGRGGKQAYQTDSEVIQLATSTFFSDVHGGFNATNSQWGDTALAATTNHYYPCALPGQSQPFLTTSITQFDIPNNPNNPRLLQSAAGSDASDGNVSASAIWMGLLVNAPYEQTFVQVGGTNDRGNVSALGNDTGLYLQKMPKSAKASNSYNGNIGTGGGYAWVVGKNGTVYGVYQPGLANTPWYVGFSGSYP